MKFEAVKQTNNYIAFSVSANDLMKIADSPMEAMQYLRDTFGLKTVCFDTYQLMSQPLYWRFVCEKPTDLWQGPTVG